jgi:hypothetical protein
MLTGKVVLAIFLIVDTVYVARIMRREVRALQRRMPRWHGPEPAFPESAAITAGADAGAMCKPFHERLDRWLDRRLAHHTPEDEPADPHNRPRRDAA